MTSTWDVVRSWRRRHWAVAAAVALITVLVVAVPTALIENPFFHRDVPTTWWSWPALAVTAVLAGLLAATYVAPQAPHPGPTNADPPSADRSARRGAVAGVLTFFAVGCPVCNKLVLVAFGYTGALTWFAPFQPVLQVVALGLLLWALRSRLTRAYACPLPPSGSDDLVHRTDSLEPTES